MKKYLLILLLIFPFFGISQTKEQIRDLVKNNFIGLSKDSVLVKFPTGLNTDTLNGIKYDVIKGRVNKILVTCYFTEPKKTEPQVCFRFRIFIVTSYLQAGDVNNILNSNFKKDKNQWIQYRSNDTINWISKEGACTVTLDALKK